LQWFLSLSAIKPVSPGVIIRLIAAGFEHYMLKEIYEQPDRLRGTLTFTELDDALFGDAAAEVFDQVQAIQIIACGTSYHAGLVARHWLEGFCGCALPS
jgi:glucosamine 6-phosphate synthetase-like amidotransferase/phosphosugar isomerase protein